MLGAKKGHLLNLVLLLCLASYAIAQEGSEVALEIEEPVEAQTESSEPVEIVDSPTSLTEAETVPNAESTTVESQITEVVSESNNQAIQDHTDANEGTAEAAESSTPPQSTVLVFTNPPQLTTAGDEETILVKQADQLGVAPQQAVSEDAGVAVQSDQESIASDPATTEASEEVKVTVEAQKAFIHLIVPGDLTINQTTAAAAEKSDQPLEVTEAAQTDQMTTSTKLLISASKNSTNKTLSQRIVGSAIRAVKKYTINAGVKVTNGLALAWITTIVSAIKLILK